MAVRTDKGEPAEILEKDLDVEDCGLVRVRYPLDPRRGTAIVRLEFLRADDGAGELRAALVRIPERDLLGRDPAMIEAIRMIAQSLEPA